MMRNARIIVTVNPEEWEGDFRLWEALGTGALVLVDWLYVPHPYPLEHMEHVVFYNSSDRAELEQYLDYFLRNPHHAQRIALQGTAHALSKHTSTSRVDYLLYTTKEEQARLTGNHSLNSNQYVWTGHQLVKGISLVDVLS